jgi:hypothetical protein
MMHAVKVEIERFVDANQPGFVECSLVDADGNRHTFIEKIPIVTVENLWIDSDYPTSGAIACVIESSIIDPMKGELCAINTERPWCVESTDGLTRFIVRADQVTLSPTGAT